MLVYIIRHGETEMNRQRRMQGQSDIPLNDYGRKLAKETGEAMDEIRFDYAFTSPLQRAVETAELLLTGKQVPLIRENRIIEISFGVYEGLSYAEQSRIPNPHFPNFFDAPESYEAPPGGESFLDVMQRAGEFWDELIHTEQYADKTILISTHGCLLKALLAVIRKTELPAFWGEGVHKNCAVTLIRVEGGITEILQEGVVFYQESGEDA